MPERRVCRDPGAEEGSDVCQRKLRGDLERVMLIYDDLRGVPAVRRSLLVLLGSVVREDEMNFAVLLQVLFAARAPPAGIHETADSCKITHFESFHLGPHARHASDNLVSGDHGENGATPLVSCLMDVRVTDAAVKNFD